MLKVSICIGSACHLKGSYNVINAFQQAIEKHGVADKVEIGGTFCLGHCGEAVSIMVGDEVFNVAPEKANEFFEATILPKVK
jgi:NADH:ubiquinone oxidoreductase subunit E